jgi:hypothetical protein
MAAGVVLVGMVALALPVLQVRRDLKVLRVQAERLASQAILVRQEVQALRERLENLATGVITATTRTAQQGNPAIREVATKVMRTLATEARPQGKARSKGGKK